MRTQSCFYLMSESQHSRVIPPQSQPPISRVTGDANLPAQIDVDRSFENCFWFLYEQFLLLLWCDEGSAPLLVQHTIRGASSGDPGKIAENELIALKTIWYHIYFRKVFIAHP